MLLATGLRRLVKRLDDVRAVNMCDVEVAAITGDSRDVRPGSLFVALRGVSSDGHRFIDDALHRGAVAVVSEHAVKSGAAPNIIVGDSAKALAILSAVFYGDPAASLHMFGVTGTNGKTSTAHLFRAIAEASAWGHLGVIGTIGHGASRGLVAAVHTTPEPVALHKLLKDMKDQGCNGVVMEVSSHAVRQQRVWGIDFEIGMLTNVTRDHLDYHHTFEDYVGAKREFCHSLAAPGRQKENGTLIYSRDNVVSREIGEGFAGEKRETSVAASGDVFAEDIDATIEGTRFRLHLGDVGDIVVKLKLLGSFSVENAVMAAAGAIELGIDAGAIKRGLESVAGIPGRFEAMGGSGKPVVVVDYSHTPDSLERTLEFCRGLEPERLIVIFGCGGDRDRGKRPMMGKIAQRLSDVCYVTSDNPRTEDPERIIEDILSGMDMPAEGVFVETDRALAILGAIERAAAGDLISICGKGHEDYQIMGAERHHFDDREHATRALNAWSSN